MKKQFDFIGHRKVFLIISLVIIVAGILCSILMPIDLDISFKGGTLVRYTFSGDLDEGQVDDFVSAQLGRSVEVPPFSSDMSGTSLIEISLPDQLSVEELDALHAAMAEEYSDHNITLVQANSLKPSMGRNFLIKCLVAVALAAIFLVIYVALRFRKIGGWSAGAMAVAALFHDLLIAFFAFVVFRIPLNDNFVAVLLSILGYSLNATIVVYDRIRENRRLMDAKTPLSEIVNVSLNQSFTRTLNTSICTFLAIGTVAVIALAMNLESIVSFAVPMMFGVLSGFYSSVCLCSPTWVLWQEHRDKKEALKKAAGKKAKA
ncbi:MAG: protein translocase subunit SecF [Clostridiales bacterium]|nr:protein translocase subunit SecF [Clostridiales bacterium]